MNNLLENMLDGLGDVTTRKSQKSTLRKQGWRLSQMLRRLWVHRLG